MDFINKTVKPKFREICKENNFYVDKTLFIKNYIDHIEKVNIITRPRGSGKTLNLDMLDEFLNLNKNSYDLFKDKLISKHEDYLNEHLNKHPIIRLDFGNLGGNDLEAFKINLKKELSNAVNLCCSYLDLTKLDEFKLKKIDKMHQNKYERVVVSHTIQDLSYILYLYYNKKVIVLIDNYDYPFMNSFIYNYSKEVANILGPLLLISLKANNYLFGALLVGVKYTNLVSISERLNNAVQFKDYYETYPPFFGFSENEVKEILEKNGLLNEFEAVKNWYAGYEINKGDKVIISYNPKSIVEFLINKKLMPYNFDNDVIIDLLKRLPEYDYNYIKERIQKNYRFYFHESFYNTYELENNYNEVVSLLYDAGYLKETNGFIEISNPSIRKALEALFNISR